MKYVILCVYISRELWRLCMCARANSVLLMTASPPELNQRFVHLIAVKSALATCHGLPHVFTPFLGALPAPSIIPGWRLRQYSLLGNLYSGVQQGPARPAQHGPAAPAQLGGRSVSTWALWLQTLPGLIQNRLRPESDSEWSGWDVCFLNPSQRPAHGHMQPAHNTRHQGNQRRLLRDAARGN